ncbi:hypothetical protein NCCP2716_22260 [Sporosarcina sp. NCCP-2716]|uniref:TIGR02678 family protein n=1 Tax=Sporosarcina sp. NCCP-2716 TaxID=2943679 RepID=UPI00203ACE5D|nr:TIGR02678 family protein [Sporosarcina sp. NCCP-2716]GKV69728.1 hypothetical protein NCCP2716_22260 [Sporosarcina sp. NCCP-2716]
METGHLFDGKAVQALDLLLHRYWILRSEEPELYQLVREREKVLRRYIDEKLGLRLLIHQHFVKLEKIPAEPEPWMGIQLFQEPLDYAIFCCALSYIEGKAVDEQFLLSEFCEEIQNDFPGDYPLDWTLYAHRKSLIRTMKGLLEFRLLRTIDGDIGRFDHNEEQEVLYEATPYSRYFLRTFPEDFSAYAKWEELLEDEWKANQEDERRKRVYRKLFFSPGLHRNDIQDPDFLYIRQFRNRLSEDIEQHSDYRLQVYKNTAFLAISEPKQHHRVFPDTKSSTDLLLQLSDELHSDPERYVPNERGELLFTEGEFDQLIDKLRADHGTGWAKLYREKSTGAVRADLLEALGSWMMGDFDLDGSLIRIKPLLGVLTGAYPADYEQGGEKS